MRTTTTALKSRLRPGQVYRRQELEPYSSNLNRDLQALIRSGALKKAAYGIYNHKRHGVFQLNGRMYEFRRRPYFPKELTEEFLLVEFLNERPSMPEEVPLRPEHLKARIEQLNRARLERIIKYFGKIYTQKIYAAITAQ